MRIRPLGSFEESDLETELKMIDTNIKAVHILTKLFLRDLRQKPGYILNVASSAAFYARGSILRHKGIRLRLTQAIGKN